MSQKIRLALGADTADVTHHRIVSRAEAGLAAPKKPLATARLLRSELFVHHTVTPDRSDPFASWRLVQQAAFGRGFTDISYTYGIEGDATILEGRSPLAVGAHTEGWNVTAHAIVFIGNYETDVLTDEQIDAFRWLRLQLVARGQLTPAHRTRPHRAVKATACPGRNVWSPIPWWSLMQPWQPPTPPPPPPAPKGDWTEEMIVALPELSRANRAAQAADANKHQQTKNLQGLLQAANRNVAIDGDFGPGTENELRTWQQAAGCQATGTTTEETWRTLLGA